MTLSIAARCPDTGMLGTAICSSSIAVASRCAHVRAGVGAALSQNVTDPSLGSVALDWMGRGLTAEEVLQRLIREQPLLDWRQIVLVPAQGAPAIFSGRHALGIPAQAVGAHSAAAGNLLANDVVPAAMVETFERVRGHLAERLVQALEAGMDAGGEAGPVHAAGVKVAGTLSWPVVDLRVDWSDDPVTELRTLWRQYEPQLAAYVTRAESPGEAPAYGVPGESRRSPPESTGAEAMLERLVSFDTTSHRSNLPLIHFVRDYLASHGIDSRIIEDSSGRKANLLATIGPASRPGFLLSGHTDVVPADGHAWTSDPFRLERRGDRLFGRGSADMKGFIASVLAAAPRFAHAPLRTPVHLAFTYDEEVGCLGVRDLLEVVNAFPIKPAMGVVGEPTSMHVAVGHKGKIAFRVRVVGREAHSSSPAAGVNAVEHAAQLIAFVSALNEDKRQSGPFDASYSTPHTTLHVGNVRGGTTLNIVPAECVFEFEIRHLPNESPLPLVERIRTFVATRMEPAMKAVDPATAIHFEECMAYPALATAPDAGVVTFVQSLVGGRQPAESVAFGTEAGLFQETCRIPMVICGPGAMADAHRPDESIAVSQLAACDAFLARLTAALC